MSFIHTSRPAALRHEPAHRVNWLAASIAGVAILLAMSVASATAPQPIVVGGTGASGPLVRVLADEFQRAHPGTEVIILSPPLGSSGGLRALAAGNISLAITAFAPSREQRVQLGEAFELARTPFVFATSDGQRPQGFQLAEVADIYAGHLVKWTNALPLRLILRSEYDAETRIVRSMSPDIDRENRKALHRKGMVIAENDLDAIDLIERIEGSFGTTTLGLLKVQNRSVSVIALNGVTPSAATLENRSYPWFKAFHVVSPRSPSPATLKFMEFLRSDKASEIMRRYEYLPGRR